MGSGFCFWNFTHDSPSSPEALAVGLWGPKRSEARETDVTSVTGLGYKQG